MVEFLGQVDSPSAFEADFLEPILRDPAIRVKAFKAMEGRSEWLTKLIPHLSLLMAGDEGERRHATGFLRSAAKHAPEAVLGLVETHWQHLTENDSLSIRVLSGLEKWDERSVRLAERVVQRSPVSDPWTRSLAEAASKTAPELAPRIVAAELSGCFKVAEAMPAEAPPVPGPDATDGERFLHEVQTLNIGYREIKAIVDDGHRWHDLPKVAEASPTSFVEHVWPWIVHVADRCSRREGRCSSSYREDHIFSLDSRSPQPDPFAQAIRLAIRLFSETEPAKFLAFAEANTSLDSMTVHRLLSGGLVQLGQAYSDRLVTYLLGDTRRFSLGSGHCDDTRALISASVEGAADGLREALEKGILAYEKYSAESDDDAESRRDLSRWNREERLRLLRSFPLNLLSTPGRALVLQEERAFPGLRDRDFQIGWAKLIGSPIAPSEMAKASEADLLRAFDELHDGTGTRHPNPRRHMEGGGIQAAQVFGEVAKADPDRAFRIIEKLDPSKHQRYAGSAIRSIVDSQTFDPARILSVVHDLDARGFTSDDFRNDVSWALEKVSGEAKGLPPQTCELLESWLRDESQSAEEKEHDESRGSEPRSILLDDRSGILPHGNYPTLYALFLGFMQRDPWEPNSWLAVLERHLQRVEHPRVWRALAGHQVKYLEQADRPRAISLIDELLGRVPGLLFSPAGLRLLATVHSWLPQEIVGRSIEAWLTGSWADGPQAAAELAMLRYGLVPSDDHAAGLVEAVLASTPAARHASEMRLGLTYLAAELWDHAPARATATKVLVRLLPISEPSEARAWAGVFRSQGPPLADLHTQRLLNAIADEAEVLRHSHSGFLIDHLKGLLEQDREYQRVCLVVSKLMAENASAVGDIRTAWAGSAGSLVDIALTLQRYGPTRACGLDIFETLMDADAYKISEALQLLDRRLPG